MISFRRATSRDSGKNLKQNSSLSSPQFPFILATVRVYHCLASSTREKGNNFHPRVSRDMPAMVLALLKYPFYYTIRSCFGKFFGMIYVLTRHLAPELDRFRFCPGFWSMLHFDRNLGIFGDVLTHGYNWAKMRNKREIQ